MALEHVGHDAHSFGGPVGTGDAVGLEIGDALKDGGGSAASGWATGEDREVGAASAWSSDQVPTPELTNPTRETNLSATGSTRRRRRGGRGAAVTTVRGCSRAARLRPQVRQNRSPSTAPEPHPGQNMTPWYRQA